MKSIELLFLVLIFLLVGCARKNNPPQSGSISDSSKAKSSVVKSGSKSSLYVAPKLAFWFQPLQINPFEAAVKFEYEVKEYKTDEFVSAAYSDSISLSSKRLSPYISLGFELGNKNGFYFQALYSAMGFRNTKQEVGIGYNGWQSKSKRWSIRPYFGFQLTRNRFRFNSYIDNHRRDIRFEGELFEHFAYKPSITDILMGSFLRIRYSDRLWPQLQHTSFGALALWNVRYSLNKSWFVSLATGYYFPFYETLRFRLHSYGNTYSTNLDNPVIHYSDNRNGDSRRAITSRGILMMVDLGYCF